MTLSRRSNGTSLVIPLTPCIKVGSLFLVWTTRLTMMWHNGAFQKILFTLFVFQFWVALWYQ